MSSKCTSLIVSRLPCLLLLMSLGIPLPFGLGLVPKEAENARLDVVFDGTWHIIFNKGFLEEFYTCLCSNRARTCSFSYRQDNSQIHTVISTARARLHLGEGQDAMAHFVCDQPQFVNNFTVLCRRQTPQSTLCSYSPPCEYHKLEFYESSCIIPCVHIGWLRLPVSYESSSEVEKPESGTCPHGMVGDGTGSGQPRSTRSTPRTETPSTRAYVTTRVSGRSASVPGTQFPSTPGESSVDNSTPIVSGTQGMERAVGQSGEAKGDDTAVFIGAGVGSALAVTVVLIAATLLYRRWRRRAHGGKETESALHSHASSSDVKNEYTFENRGNSLPSGGMNAISANEVSGYSDYDTSRSVYSTIADSDVRSPNSAVGCSANGHLKDTFSTPTAVKTKTKLKLLEELKDERSEVLFEETGESGDTVNPYIKLNNGRVETCTELEDEVLATYNAAVAEYDVPKPNVAHLEDVRMSRDAAKKPGGGTGSGIGDHGYTDVDSCREVVRATEAAKRLHKQHSTVDHQRTRGAKSQDIPDGVSNPYSVTRPESDVPPAEVNDNSNIELDIKDHSCERSMHKEQLSDSTDDDRPQSSQYFVLEGDEVGNCVYTESENRPRNLASQTSIGCDGAESSKYFVLENGVGSEFVPLETETDSFKDLPDRTENGSPSTEYFMLESGKEREYVDLDTVNEDVERLSNASSREGGKPEYLQLEDGVGREYIDLDAVGEDVKRLSHTGEHRHGQERNEYFEILGEEEDQNHGGVKSVHQTKRGDVESTLDSRHDYQEIAPGPVTDTETAEYSELEEVRKDGVKSSLLCFM